VLSAWRDGAAIAGLVSDRAWRWDGAALTTSELPEPAIGGGPDVFVGTFGKVWRRRGETWVEAGRLEVRPGAEAIAGVASWAGNIVVAAGSVLQVVGPTAFRLDAGSELLPPVAWGDDLVVASLDGRVWVFAP
jgi:hypothetical protein